MQNNPNNSLMNPPIYKISGLDRRAKKKELSLLKSYVRNFWYCHQLDKDMTSFYGGSNGYPMSDEEATKRFEKSKKEMEQMELILSEKINYEIQEENT